MKSFSAHVQKASASSLPLGRAAPQDCFQGARNLVPSTAPGFLGSRSGLEAILPLRSSGRARLPVMQAIAVAPDLALHDVRYVDGETVGATPKFRQICMSSSLKVPFNNTLPLPKLGKDVQEGLDAVGRTAAAMRQKKAVVKVVGVGYGGSKAVEAMLQKTGLEAAEFFLVAADSESLPEPSSRLPESHKIVLGLDKLMGAQLKSDIDLEEELEAQLDGADLVVVVAGMGGNTGGVPPVVAKVARRIGALTVGLMTKPFAFEGPRRSSLAEKHVAMMKKRTDTLIVVPCDQLLEGKDPNFGVRDAFKLVDSVLRQGVKGLTDMVTGSGLVDANLSEVQTLLTDAGLASMGVGSAAGPGRASAAAQAALASSSLSKGLQSAQGVVYSMSGDPSLSLYEVAEISEIVQAHVGGFAKANVLFAASTDEHMQGRVQVTVIAAGLPEARLIPAEKGRQMARATMVVGSSRRSSSIMWSTR